MDERSKEVVDAYWCETFKIERSTLGRGGVLVVVAPPGIDDIASVRLADTCFVRVPAQLAEAADELFSGMSVDAGFTEDALKQLLGDQARVFGPSWHHYGSQRSLRAEPSPLVRRVNGEDPELLSFLGSNSIDDWAESGFPEEPASANPSDTTFHVLHEGATIVAAGNMTDWRGLSADVGVLVRPLQRGRGHARRLVSAMVEEALPRVEVVRYRASSTNLASLALANRLGFQPYGSNYIARAAPR